MSTCIVSARPRRSLRARTVSHRGRWGVQRVALPYTPIPKLTARFHTRGLEPRLGLRREQRLPIRSMNIHHYPPTRIVETTRAQFGARSPGLCRRGSRRASEPSIAKVVLRPQRGQIAILHREAHLDERLAVCFSLWLFRGPFDSQPLRWMTSGTRRADISMLHQ